MTLCPSFEQRIDALVRALVEHAVALVTDAVTARIGAAVAAVADQPRTPNDVDVPVDVGGTPTVAPPTVVEHEPASVPSRRRVAPENAAPQGSSPKRPACSKCGGFGHNARSCGRAPKGHAHRAKPSHVTEVTGAQTVSAAWARAPQIFELPTVLTRIDTQLTAPVSRPPSSRYSEIELAAAKRRIAERDAQASRVARVNAARPKVARPVEQPRAPIVAALPVPRYTVMFDTSRRAGNYDAESRI